MFDALLLDSETGSGYTHLGMVVVGFAGSLVAAAGRSGGNAFQVTNAGSGVQKPMGSAVGTINLAFGYSPAAFPSSTGGIVLFSDAGTSQVSFAITNAGAIQFYRGNFATLLGTSAAVLTLGVYQHVEVTVTISATVGTVQVWVNSVSVLSLTGLNTKATGNTTVDSFTLQGPVSGNHNFCDVIWKDSRIGDRRVVPIGPTGPGHYTQFTPSAGANWQCVDEVPPNDGTDFNSDTNVGDSDSFVHAALPATATVIDGVIVQVRGANTTTGVGSLAPLLRSGTTDSVGSGTSLNTSYQTLGHLVATTDPATGLAWASAGVNASEFGYQKTA